MITQLPWFFTFDFLQSGDSPLQTFGDEGGWDSRAGLNSIVEAASKRRLRLGTYVFEPPGEFRVNLHRNLWRKKIVIGFGFRTNNEFDAAGIRLLSPMGAVGPNLWLDDGVLKVRRGTTTLETISAVNDQTDRKVEFAVHIDDTAGSYEVRFDGVDVASASGVNIATSDNLFATLELEGTGGGAGRWLEFFDFYIKEWDGPTNPGFLEDATNPLQMAWQAPGSDVVSGWTPDSGGTNYTQVDDASPDGDTTRVDADMSETEDEYGGFPSVGSVSAIVAVVPALTGVGPSGGEPAARLGLSGGSRVLSTGRLVDPSSYRRVLGKAHVTQPGGSTPWTAAAVDAATLILRARNQLSQEITQLTLDTDGLVFVDSFDRADSTDLGGDWVEHEGGWTITSNRLRVSGNNGTESFAGNPAGNLAGGFLQVSGMSASDANSAVIMFVGFVYGGGTVTDGYRLGIERYNNRIGMNHYLNGTGTNLGTVGKSLSSSLFPAQLYGTQGFQAGWVDGTAIYAEHDGDTPVGGVGFQRNGFTSTNQHEDVLRTRSPYVTVTGLPEGYVVRVRNSGGDTVAEARASSGGTAQVDCSRFGGATELCPLAGWTDVQLLDADYNEVLVWNDEAIYPGHTFSAS